MADREAVTIDADEARYAALEKEVQAWGDESEEVKQPDPAPTEAAARNVNRVSPETSVTEPLVSLLLRPVTSPTRRPEP